MNLNRIVSGTLIAGLVVIGMDFLIHHVLLIRTWHELQQAGHVLPAKSYTFPLILTQDFVIGFILTWLYVLARPRLGPGPQTAVVMGTLAWFLLFVPYSLTLWLWFPVPAKVPAIQLLGGLIQCWVGIYLAGWQYIEKAP